MHLFVLPGRINMDKPIVSVIVCTYNRCNIFPICLNSLANQKDVDKSLYEVIIINNNSTDNTQKIASQFANRNSNFRVFIEKKQGLSHSRNRGWKEARGEYIAYIDDDARADSRWILKMINFIKKHPDILAFGGPYYGFSLKSFPKWFPQEYGTKQLSKYQRKLRKGKEHLSGTNMVFHKSLFLKFGGFNPNFGMSGDNLGYGEEPEFQDRLYNGKVDIYYNPDLKVEHLIASYKQRLSWLLKSSYCMGIANQKKKARNDYNIKDFINAWLNFFIQILLQVQKKIPFKRKVYYCAFPLMFELGKFHYYIRRKITSVR